jgi:hypothetical protein
MEHVDESTSKKIVLLKLKSNEKYFLFAFRLRKSVLCSSRG